MKLLRRTVFSLTLMLALSSVCTAQITEVQFSEKEKQFINEHPVIHLCVDPEFVPYEFIDTDGEYKGIAADYAKILSEKIGMQMVVEKDLNWAEAYEMAVEKKLDVLPCVAKTEKRKEYFLFSEPYMDFKRVIVVKDNDKTVNSLDDLKETGVAVQTNSSHHSYLKSHSEIELSLYNTVDDALAAVSNGSEPAYIGNLATSSYLIKENGITNLKYITINTEDKQSLHFAVRNDWPELVSIINKSLASITQEEKIEINNKWIGVENEIDYGLIMQIVSVILAFLFISVFWTVKLKREAAKRILIEEELRRAKTEAEIANQTKSSFLARMSHEIRTPLNAITGMAYLMQKTDVNVTQKMYMEKITQASYNMLGIINDILDFSKIESGKIELERISFDLDKLIQQVISIISFRIEEQGITFSMNKDPKMPINFFGDPKRIEQILINIINNAVKFTTAGEVSLEVNVIDHKNDFCELEFCIKDTGIGMSKKQLEQLFTPFAQGDSSINRRFGGTGLGLSIVKSLTDLMGGEIDVKSVQGEGSTFIIKLSLEIDQSKENEDKQKAATFYFQDVKALVLDKSSSNLKLIENSSFAQGIERPKPENSYQVLVVEDNKTNQFIAKAILEEVGYEVVLTENGEEGAAYFKDHQKEIDLILMDLHMPVLNGYEASILIRKLDTQVPIVAMTADAITGIEEECKRVGINYYISKPFDPEKLLDTLYHIIKSRREEKNVLDESDGLKRIGNNIEVYQMILKEYLNENKDVVESLKNAIGDHNYQEAIQIVHKNKSGSGNIGAKKLFIIATELQKALSEGSRDVIERLFDEFSDTLIQLLREIENKFKP